MKNSDPLNQIHSSRPWYGVRYLLRDSANNVYQEDTVLVKAESQEEALTKAEKIAEDFCESMEGYSYTGYAEVFHLFDEALSEGVEVYSTLRASSLEAEDYIRRFLRTGDEKGFAKNF